jgi:hypothetical protein
MANANPSSFSDRELLIETRRVAVAERQTTAALVSLLAEVDARRLYLGEGYSSMFAFCTRALRLSEPAARPNAARDLPIDDPAVSAAMQMPAPPPVMATPAAAPQPAAPTLACVSARRSLVAPISPKSYLVRITVSEETHRKLERARDLLRHQIPDGDPAAIVDRALTVLLAQAERTKFAARMRPAPTGTVQPPTGPTRARSRGSQSGSRRIPAALRRAVWARDEGRCAFVGADGRCAETGFLEFHHVVPFAAGGPSVADNLQLRCRAHNGYEAALEFGDWRLAQTPSGRS